MSNKQPKRLARLFVFGLIAFCCNINHENKKHPILLAGREAPLGWVYLTLNDDSTFTFLSRGLREGTPITGNFKFKNDTLYFEYKDSIPNVGKIAVLDKFSVSYIAGDYPETLEIKLNRLTK